MTAQRGNQRRAQFFCNVCLNSSGTQEAALKHKTLCSRRVSKMPHPHNNTLEFTQVQHQLQVPFFVYADIECILEPNNFEVSPKLLIINEHIPISYACYIKCAFDSKLDKFVLETGKNSGISFVNSLIKNLTKLSDDYLHKIVPMKMTLNEQQKFDNSLNSSICQKVLGTDRVRDHYHFTGRFRGAAHSKCNLVYKVNKFIGVFFHNFSRYYCHLLSQELGKIPGEISVISINKENHISVSKKMTSLSGNSYTRYS